MKKYVYHFDDGKLDPFSNSLDNRIGDTTSHHEHDYLELICTLLSVYREGAILDVGAGVGRVTSVARERAAEVVALEPDEERWQICHEALHDDPACKVLCQTTSKYIAENPGKQFDFIVVGMVLQHISTVASRKLMEEVATLLKPHGTAIISTTHVPAEYGGFSFSYSPNASKISEEEFNRYAQLKPEEQSQGLPVRRFSKDNLIDLVSEFFEPILWREMSFINENGAAFFAKQWEVDKDKLQGTGLSQYVMVQKTAS